MVRRVPSIRRRRPYKRLALEKKTTRFRLHEQSPVRADATFLGFEAIAICIDQCLIVIRLRVRDEAASAESL